MQDIIAHLDALYRSEDYPAWRTAHYQDAPPPFYSSVDVRHSALKLAPVDTNLFPAGFNNLTTQSIEQAASVTKASLQAHYNGDIQSALILPENHTRNQGYIDNLHAMVRIIEGAGLTCHIGRMDEANSDDVVTLTTSTGLQLRSTPIRRGGDRIATLEGFTPDLILVNNDLTSGAPEILCQIKQPVLPPIGLGWYRRRKSVYFAAYDAIVKDFCARFGGDEWLLSTFSHQCGTVNFKEKKGIECVALGVEKVLHRLREKYKQYGISEEPYVFIKADSGTYGMGIMTARSGDEVIAMNKKIRKKMDVVKEGAHNTQVIIQEGVPTATTHKGAIAEPVIYLISGQAIGGAWRVNEGRDVYRNLNASGMHFVPMESDFRTPSASAEENAHRLIAELASLAAAHEKYDTPLPCEEEE